MDKAVNQALWAYCWKFFSTLFWRTSWWECKDKRL